MHDVPYFSGRWPIGLSERIPKNLTLMTVSAQGGRNKAAGMIEELAIPGLAKEFICGHLETSKKFLELGDKGQIDIHTMPQGEILFLLEAQAKGEYQLTSTTGLGTFLDPLEGGTTAVTPNTTKSYVKRKGELLEYNLPPVNIAMFSAPYADAEGNIYFKHAAAITENVEAANAALHNDGKVLVVVSGIIPKEPDEISVPAEKVSAVVVFPGNIQTAFFRQKRYWKSMTAGANESIDNTLQKIDLINRLAGITARRGPAESMIGRMAASLFAKYGKKNSLVNIGVGLPEEVSA